MRIRKRIRNYRTIRKIHLIGLISLFTLLCSPVPPIESADVNIKKVGAGFGLAWNGYPEQLRLGESLRKKYVLGNWYSCGKVKLPFRSEFSFMVTPDFWTPGAAVGLKTNYIALNEKFYGSSIINYKYATYGRNAQRSFSGGLLFTLKLLNNNIFCAKPTVGIEGFTTHSDLFINKLEIDTVNEDVSFVGNAQIKNQGMDIPFGLALSFHVGKSPPWPHVDLNLMPGVIYRYNRIWRISTPDNADKLQKLKIARIPEHILIPCLSYWFTVGFGKNER